MNPARPQLGVSSFPLVLALLCFALLLLCFALLCFALLCFCFALLFAELVMRKGIASDVGKRVTELVIGKG